MQDNQLMDLWKSQDEKMNEVLTFNRKIIFELTREKLNKTISKLRTPKHVLLLISIPYTFVLLMITLIAFISGGVFVTLGFGIIATIMIATIVAYLYQLYLVNQVTECDEVLVVQKKLARLKISSVNCARLAVLQLPFWSLCWVSLNALQDSPFLYGGVNLAVFLLLSGVAIWLFRGLNPTNPNPFVANLFLQGKEWEPIEKSVEILEELKEYESPPETKDHFS